MKKGYFAFLFRIIVVGLISLLMAVSPFAIASADNKLTSDSKANILTDGFQKISENDLFELYVATGSGNFCIRNKESLAELFAFPDVVEEDVIESFAFSLKSLLNVKFSFEGASPAEVVTYGEEGMTFKLFQTDNGIRYKFIYDYMGASFTVQMRVSLEKDYVSCTVDFLSIEEGKGVKILQITPLPNLCTANSQESGYVFIPDGSGVLVKYSDSVGKSVKYSEPVYGTDSAKNMNNSGVVEDSLCIRLPIYGFVKDDTACLAVIHKGDAFANINAEQSYDYLTCNASFDYRANDMEGIKSITGSTTGVNNISENAEKTSPEFRLYFLSKDNADYSGMACTFRDYLIKEKGLKKSNSPSVQPLTIEAFGAVQQKVNFFGIPFKKTKSVTTFEDIIELNKKLADQGIENSNWILYGFLKGGFENKSVSSPKYISLLGGKKGYESTVNTVGEKNVYTVYELAHRYATTKSWFNTVNDIKLLNQLISERYYQKLSNGTQNGNYGIWTYRNIASVKKLSNKIIDNAVDNQGLVFSYMGSELYSNFSNSEPSNRTELMNTYTEILGKAKKNKLRVASEGGNLYSALNSDFIYEIPLTSSGHSIESESIPFYTMVFHGYVPMASQPINNHSEKELVLLAFEQGASLTFRYSATESYDLIDTKLNFLFNSSDEKLLRLSQCESIKSFADIHSELVDKAIIKRDKKNGIATTVYENGWQVIVNYSNTVQNYSGKEMAPYSFFVVK